MKKLLGIGKQYDIDKQSFVNISETHTPFEGFPVTLSNNLLRLFSEPFSMSGMFYEFFMENISKVDDLGQITNTDGTAVNKVRVWAKKGLPAVKSESFIVK